MKTEIKRRGGTGGHMDLDELQYFYVLGEMIKINPKLGAKVKWKLHTHTHSNILAHVYLISRTITKEQRKDKKPTDELKQNSER